MSKKILAIVGSYRKGGTIDTAVDAILAAAAEKGAQTGKIYLLDKRIEFCTNCRCCTQAPGPQRGRCVQHDDMEGLLAAIEGADGLVIAAPVNYFNLNALTRRFMERLVGCAYWPWGGHGPQFRTKERTKKAVLVTSTAMPAIMGRLFTGAVRALKLIAQSLGAKPVATLFIGHAGGREAPPLTEAVRRKARAAAGKLAIRP